MIDALLIGRAGDTHHLRLPHRLPTISVARTRAARKYAYGEPVILDRPPDHRHFELVPPRRGEVASVLIYEEVSR